MQKVVLCGIIAAVVVAGGVGIAFATVSMNNNNTTDANSQLSLPQEQSSDDNEVRVIQHDLGETTIIGTPERIVTLHRHFAEDVLALGIEPVGTSGLELTKSTMETLGFSLSSNVEEVGNNPPNLETISQLQPDLIIGVPHSHGEIYDELSEIAPTLILHP